MRFVPGGPGRDGEREGAGTRPSWSTCLTPSRRKARRPIRVVPGPARSGRGCRVR